MIWFHLEKSFVTLYTAEGQQPTSNILYMVCSLKNTKPEVQQKQYNIN
jgi:hypothetical protein